MEFFFLDYGNYLRFLPFGKIFKFMLKLFLF